MCDLHICFKVLLDYLDAFVSADSRKSRKELRGCFTAELLKKFTLFFKVFLGVCKGLVLFYEL